MRMQSHQAVSACSKNLSLPLHCRPAVCPSFELYNTQIPCTARDKPKSKHKYHSAAGGQRTTFDQCQSCMHAFAQHSSATTFKIPTYSQQIYSNTGGVRVRSIHFHEKGCQFSAARGTLCKCFTKHPGLRPRWSTRSLPKNHI